MMNARRTANDRRASRSRKLLRVPARERELDANMGTSQMGQRGWRQVAASSAAQRTIEQKRAASLHDSRVWEALSASRFSLRVAGPIAVRANARCARTQHGGRHGGTHESCAGRAASVVNNDRRRGHGRGERNAGDQHPDRARDQPRKPKHREHSAIGRVVQQPARGRAAFREQTPWRRRQNARLFWANLDLGTRYGLIQCGCYSACCLHCGATIRQGECRCCRCAGFGAWAGH
jgi:hypothetical protein